MINVAQIRCRDLARTDDQSATRLLAGAMRESPVVVRTFGSNSDKRERRLVSFYAQAVASIRSHGAFFGAFAGQRLLGVLGALRPGCCQRGFWGTFRFVPSLLAHNTLAAVLRVKHWQDAWTRRDPHKVHWHLGLFAVEADARGSGVGSQLMSEHCARMDHLDATSYLETDQTTNVRFYQRLGYRVVGQEPVLGITTWFMERLANSNRESRRVSC
jgi:ribosomal protein S18 acetylase RimI-like enzyme